MSQQVANAVILIRPTGFGYDPETALTNGFQRKQVGSDLLRLAAEEFDGLLEALRSAGIDMVVLDPLDRRAPNGVFPNNWFSTHHDGTVVLYPMCTASRRVERDPDMARVLSGEGYTTGRTLDFSAWEHKGVILEGTGSLVLDRDFRKAFACVSERTTETALNAWCEALGYTPIAFTATSNGYIGAERVYHTNVVMSIGEGFAVVCFEAMPYPAERQELDDELRKSGKEVIPITLRQMHAYVGNLLQLRARPRAANAMRVAEGGPYIFLSGTAFNALYPEQRLQLQRHGQLVPVSIPTIESVGGGSVRCMLAENFLERG